MNLLLRGSSPHMRGTLACLCGFVGDEGIIPAYAGNTGGSPSAGSAHRDHPRICGEHAVEKPTKKDYMGSSPHMRGTRLVADRVHDVTGIIPAYAGNTPCAIFRISVTRDHPRICGEHLPQAWLAGRLPGSSPHMRGTPSLWWRVRRPAGIIPAYAGNTRVRIRFVQRNWDHPRICGEHVDAHLIVVV